MFVRLKCPIKRSELVECLNARSPVFYVLMQAQFRACGRLYCCQSDQFGWPGSLNLETIAVRTDPPLPISSESNIPASRPFLFVWLHPFLHDQSLSPPPPFTRYVVEKRGGAAVRRHADQPVQLHQQQAHALRLLQVASHVGQLREPRGRDTRYRTLGLWFLC